jgi:hypothetical protein
LADHHARLRRSRNAANRPSSEPALSKDDIFLLLTLGLTRTELDRAQSATAGGSVALEALGRLTGADDAVKENIPVIDEFKLGSAYSSRTGRTNRRLRSASDWPSASAPT